MNYQRLMQAKGWVALTLVTVAVTGCHSTEPFQLLPFSRLSERLSEGKREIGRPEEVMIASVEEEESQRRDQDREAEPLLAIAPSERDDDGLQVIIDDLVAKQRAADASREQSVSLVESTSPTESSDTITQRATEPSTRATGAFERITLNTIDIPKPEAESRQDPEPIQLHSEQSERATTSPVNSTTPNRHANEAFDAEPNISFSEPETLDAEIVNLPEEPESLRREPEDLEAEPLEPLLRQPEQLAIPPVALPRPSDFEYEDAEPLMQEEVQEREAPDSEKPESQTSRWPEVIVIQALEEIEDEPVNDFNY